ncbi:hypothetical protein IFM89_033168 [Coptis chinensis]|uniref:RNase H type-1 domain-containing protein n=1 Tax=Coptis chinensis TaxID=261450 RepID=A0A835M2C1_9MAGN|nr:hypothetical protein IFM89_033168 [Coptis chinensis]
MVNQCVWQKPSFFVLNPNGTLQPHCAGYGGVIRDKDGNALLTYNDSSKYRSILFQELLGIMEGIMAASMIGIRQLEINSDFKRAISILKGL